VRRDTIGRRHIWWGAVAVCSLMTER